MSEKTELQKASEETMRFMRGQYIADEIGDGNDTLRFRRGGKTILTVYICDSRYDFHVIFGKAEREKFEQQRHLFSEQINELYDSSKTYHDGKWLLISVATLDALESVKQLVKIKKKPNRKPFPAMHKLVGECGHRCDLCIHYKGHSSVSDELLEYAWTQVKSLYGGEGERDINCGGCGNDNGCGQETCLFDKSKIISSCVSCEKKVSCKTRAAGWTPEIHTGTITADQVTWAILPYVMGQYGN